MKHPLILLQAVSESEGLLGVFIMAVLSIGIILLLAMSGKVQMGFQVPGFATPLRRSRKKILSKYFGYYNQLSAENKRKFEQKVQEFIFRKDFIPRHIETVTEEMKVLIAACAIQLTLGLPRIFLTHFQRIIVYPDDYYSTINKQYHKGEVNPRVRAIVLSWKHFLEGYINLTDGYNLGLHEMTHALHLENRINNEEYAFFDMDALKKWRAIAHREMNKINHGESHFLRAYAGTNKEEFLAVAVENFFEKSAEFKQTLPEVYETLALLLNQDPLKN